MTRLKTWLSIAKPVSMDLAVLRQSLIRSSSSPLPSPNCTKTVPNVYVRQIQLSWTVFCQNHRHLVLQMTRLYFTREKLVASNQLLTPHYYGQVVPKADNLKPQQVDDTDRYVSRIFFQRVDRPHRWSPT